MTELKLRNHISFTPSYRWQSVYGLPCQSESIYDLPYQSWSPWQIKVQGQYCYDNSSCWQRQCTNHLLHQNFLPVLCNAAGRRWRRDCKHHQQKKFLIMRKHFQATRHEHCRRSRQLSKAALDFHVQHTSVVQCVQLCTVCTPRAQVMANLEKEVGPLYGENIRDFVHAGMILDVQVATKIV